MMKQRPTYGECLPFCSHMSAIGSTLLLLLGRFVPSVFTSPKPPFKAHPLLLGRFRWKIPMAERS
jgi:hypothetical protein